VPPCCHPGAGLALSKGRHSRQQGLSPVELADELLAAFLPNARQACTHARMHCWQPATWFPLFLPEPKLTPSGHAETGASACIL